jgi:hypothetical protein
MFMRRVSFRGWEFEVDTELTSKTYGKAKEGNSDACDCGDCKNYRAQKSAAFPAEVLEFFAVVGIDYRKESEAYTTHQLENGLYHYSGWFHFAGNVLKRGSRQAIDPDTEITTLSENFRIWFRRGGDLSFFDKGTELVQVEFETHLPWIIEESEK